MDGFDTDTKVIVLAATNREDVLDSALLRAGRFDRRITVDAPDLQGRIAILKVHSKNKKLASDVNLEDIAKITPGFVGADLANLLNEAAILAARRATDTITMADLDEAVDKIGMGLGQKGKIIKPEEKKLLAYHEAGHSVMTELTEGADPVHKVTIIPRGEAGGFMLPLPEEKLVTSSKELLAEIKVLFGGRAAEELVLDDVSTGAYSDIKRATRIARMYVESVGMSKKFGPINLENPDDEFAFMTNKSDETMREIDLEVRKILMDEYLNTFNTLQENMHILEGVAQLLLKKETITGDEVRRILKGETFEQVLESEANKSKDSAENNEELKESSEKNERDVRDIKDDFDAKFGNPKEKSEIEKLEETVKELTKDSETLEEKLKKDDFLTGNKNDSENEEEEDNNDKNSNQNDTDDEDKNEDNSSDSDDNENDDSESFKKDDKGDSSTEKKKKNNFKLPSFME